MFRRIEQAGSDSVSLRIEGREFQVPAGISVAAAVLLCGFAKVRNTPVTDSPRLPYCMMGTCFDCLMCIDGVPNLQACQVVVRQNMVIEYQRGAAELQQQE
ncbi:MAG: (2Fe-2S)-binding protein [Gammaproteobacteria bacterium]|nr:(2Fe-2S)-binding protein [Gammaproteobacteria bacterium]